MDDNKQLTCQWDADTADLAYELEEAMLKVLNKHYHGMVNTSKSIQAIALATGHYVQTIEQLLSYREDLFLPFQTWVDYAHAYYVQHPSD